MAKLPKSIIKKYGISKKAWSVFRSSSASPSIKTQGTRMARRKGNRRRVSAFGRKTYRSARRSGSNTNLLMTVGASMPYGAGRQKLSDMTQSYLPRFAGQYTDEVVFGVAGWYLSKKPGIIGALGKSALIIESASIGNQLVAGMSTSSTAATPNNYYV